MERLLFGRLLLVRLVFRLALQHCLDFIFAVSCAQSAKTDEAFLPCAFDRSVFSSFDFVALLFQLLKKGFKVYRFFVQQDVVDYGTQLVTIAFFGRIKGALLPLPVRLDFNDRQLVFQTKATPRLHRSG